MKRLEDKVAIITGAASGMGAAEARLFSKEGAKVIATDIQVDKLEAVAKVIKDEGGEALPIEHDFASITFN